MATTCDRGGDKGKMDNYDDEPWKGRVLFTGPDDSRDHRVTVEPEHRYVGLGTMSREGTSDVDYLWRAAPQTAYPRPKVGRVGEIGWGISMMTDWSMPLTGQQIVLGEFRQECEDRHSHLYQNPWYPAPGASADQNQSNSRQKDSRQGSSRQQRVDSGTRNQGGQQQQRDEDQSTTDGEQRRT